MKEYIQKVVERVTPEEHLWKDRGIGVNRNDFLTGHLTRVERSMMMMMMMMM
jgi:hypothetical protein